MSVLQFAVTNLKLIKLQQTKLGKHVSYKYFATFPSVIESVFTRKVFLKLLVLEQSFKYLIFLLELILGLDYVRFHFLDLVQDLKKMLMMMMFVLNPSGFLYQDDHRVMLCVSLVLLCLLETEVLGCSLQKNALCCTHAGMFNMLIETVSLSKCGRMVITVVIDTVVLVKQVMVPLLFNNGCNKNV